MAKGNTKVRTCPDCMFPMAISQLVCPHCGRPGFAPNVDLANEATEQRKLTDRYAGVLAQCDQKGTRAIADKFDIACKSTQAVFALKVQKLYREISSGTDLFETYYDLERLKNRTESGGSLDWARLRPQAEIELLGDHVNINRIHYACLSLDGHFLDHYGDCVVTLSEMMTAHRISCFEGNTAVQYYSKRDFSGLVRSDWDNRNKLCVVMFAGLLELGSTSADFPAILVQSGTTSVGDSFVEVHLFGPMTVRTFESVRFDRKKHNSRDVHFVDAITEKLNASNIKVL